MRELFNRKVLTFRSVIPAAVEKVGATAKNIYSPVVASPFEMDHAQKTPEPLLPEL